MSFYARVRLLLSFAQAGLAMVAAASLVGGFGGRWDLGPPTADSQDAPLAPAGPLLDRGLTGQTSGLEALTNATLLGTTSGTTAGGRWGGSPLWALLFGGSDSRSSGGSHGSRGDDDGSSSAPGLDPPWSGSWIVEDRREMGLGIGLILASQALQALQLWVDREQQWREERTQQLSPLGVVGCEGIIGLVLTVGGAWGVLFAWWCVCKQRGRLIGSRRGSDSNAGRMLITESHFL